MNIFSLEKTYRITPAALKKWSNSVIGSEENRLATVLADNKWTPIKIVGNYVTAIKIVNDNSEIKNGMGVLFVPDDLANGDVEECKEECKETNYMVLTANSKHDPISKFVMRKRGISKEYAEIYANEYVEKNIGSVAIVIKGISIYSSEKSVKTFVN